MKDFKTINTKKVVDSITLSQNHRKIDIKHYNPKDLNQENICHLVLKNGHTEVLLRLLETMD